ncbi:MAG: hypothetical protein ACJASQ_001048 [Crocinitomicaceae bacterium]|jgi:hypothetical protein
MKTLLVVCFVTLSALSHGQTYEDTINYKTGLTRYCDIIKITNSTVKYKYKNTPSGRVLTTSARIALLKSYTVDGERNNLEPAFNAANLGYHDTIYLKTGVVRFARIDKETNSSIRYEFVNKNGKITNTFTRKKLLNGYKVGDKDSKIASDFSSNSSISDEKREKKKKIAKIGSRIGFGLLGLAIIASLVALIYSF